LRVLILSADIGEGHDLPARALRDALLERRPDGHVAIVDTIEAAGPLARALVRSGAETILTRARLLFDLQYWFVARCGPTRAFSGWLATAIAGRRIVALVERERPDVVVSTYPVATEVLGRLRLRGRLSVPIVSAVTDLAALHYWAHRGCELHLVIHP
jgi:processive 1,2-diacylglycerol beta-glucosyltransferase